MFSYGRVELMDITMEDSKRGWTDTHSREQGKKWEQNPEACGLWTQKASRVDSVDSVSAAVAFFLCRCKRSGIIIKWLWFILCRKALMDDIDERRGLTRDTGWQDIPMDQGRLTVQTRLRQSVARSLYLIQVRSSTGWQISAHVQRLFFVFNITTSP